VGLAIGTKS